MSDHAFGGHTPETLKAIIDERDRRYEDRFKAQEQAVKDALAAAQAHLRTVVEERDKALLLQYKEYERRLSDLNHAHERAVERNSEFVSNELYAADYKGLTDKTQINTDAISLLQQAVAVGSPELKGRLDTLAGQARGAMQQSEITWGRILAIVLMLGVFVPAAVALIVKFA